MGEVIPIRGIDPKKDKKSKTKRRKRGPEAVIVKLLERQTLERIVKSAKQKARTHAKADDWNARILLRRARLAEKRLRKAKEILEWEKSKIKGE